MADQTGFPLSALLPNDLDLGQKVKDNVSAPGAGTVKLAWDVVGAQACSALNSVLNADVFDVVGGAYTTLKDLHEYTDLAKHPKGEQSVVFLGEHSFSTNVLPALHVTIGTVPPFTMQFTLNIAVNVRAIALSICDGFITSFGHGDGDLSAQLKYGELEIMSKQESKKVQLPAHFDFKAPGLAIG